MCKRVTIFGIAKRFFGVFDSTKDSGVEFVILLELSNVHLEKPLLIFVYFQIDMVLAVIERDISFSVL